MPEDLKLSQIGSSQLPPPFRGLHYPGVRKHCQIIFACYFRKSSIEPSHFEDQWTVIMHSGKSGQNLWLAVTVKNTSVLNCVTILKIRKMELVVCLSVFTLSISIYSVWCWYTYSFLSDGVVFAVCVDDDKSCCGLSCYNQGACYQFHSPSCPPAQVECASGKLSLTCWWHFSRVG